MEENRDPKTASESPKITKRGISLPRLILLSLIVSLATFLVVSVVPPQTSGPHPGAFSHFRQLLGALQEYRSDFGAYPPSEPEETGKTDMQGAHSLFVHLNGEDGRGRRVDMPPATQPGATGPGLVRMWPPRAADLRTREVPEGKFRVFVDPWGRPIEYFKANPNGQTTATIYPRAVAMGIRIPVAKWLDKNYSDYRPGWADNSVPMNEKTFLLMSPGPDGRFGTPDDVGNW